jgi:hypothetical protein
MRTIALIFCTVSALFADLNVTHLVGFGSGAQLDPETFVWRSRVLQVLLPLLGSNMAAARVPLRDALNAGTALNSNFVDADFAQSTGLQGNGTNKILDLNIKPGDLGTSANGGLGYWESNISFAGDVEPMGCYGGPSERFVLDLRSNVESFRWGTASNGAGTSGPATSAHYYGQRSSPTLRELFKNGSSLGTNTTSDSPASASNRAIRLMGSDENGALVYWAGRCAVAYLTDGTMSSSDVSDFHTLLQTYLITPTGR